MTAFDFKNFTPDSSLSVYANSLLSRSVEKAPYESSCTAAIEYRNEVYRATIEIYARGSRYEVTAMHEDARQAVATASERLENALEAWRKERFLAVA